MNDGLRFIRAELASAAVYANSYRTLAPSIASTGLQTSALRYDSLRFSGSPRIAEEFLLNSRLRRRDLDFETSVGGYFTESAQTMLALLGHEERRTAQAIPLPQGAELRMGLGEAMRRRRSTRSYTGDSMPLRFLATIARCACGITGHTAGEPGRGLPGIALRSSPSGGAVYPIDLYFAALRVDGLPKGIYRYDPHGDELKQTGEGRDLEALLRSFAVADQVVKSSRATIVCLLVGRAWRTMRKYGDRGLRLLFLEAGLMAAHITLASMALGLGSVDCASLYDDEAHEALRLDGLYEALVHAVVVGVDV
jgi:SagB-type dehydrogenase family enzyme